MTAPRRPRRPATGTLVRDIRTGRYGCVAGPMGALYRVNPLDGGQPWRAPASALRVLSYEERARLGLQPA